MLEYLLAVDRGLSYLDLVMHLIVAIGFCGRYRMERKQGPCQRIPFHFLCLGSVASECNLLHLHWVSFAGAGVVNGNGSSMFAERGTGTGALLTWPSTYMGPARCCQCVMVDPSGKDVI